MHLAGYAVMARNLHVLRNVWWEMKTEMKLMFPAVRREWLEQFRTAPELAYARQWADAGKEIGFETMAGWYNDHVTGGNMTAELARDIYKEPTP
jgi:hypothetical protein